MNAAAVGKGVAGFVLGAALVIPVPPLALAIGLVLLGILVWARWRGEDAGPLNALGTGYLIAVVAYLVLAVAAAQ